MCKSYDHQLIRLCGMTFFDLNNHVAWVRFRNIIIYLIEMIHITHTGIRITKLSTRKMKIYSSTHFFICLPFAVSTWFSLSFPLRFGVSFADNQLTCVCFHLYLFTFRTLLFHSDTKTTNSYGIRIEQKNNNNIFIANGNCCNKFDETGQCKCMTVLRLDFVWFSPHSSLLLSISLSIWV